MAEHNTLNVAAPGVLGNDSDVDEDSLSASLLTGPANGALTLNADGPFTYTPAANFYGSDSFAYEASDGQGGTAQASASISVTPVGSGTIARCATRHFPDRT